MMLKRKVIRRTDCCVLFEAAVTDGLEMLGLLNVFGTQAFSRFRFPGPVQVASLEGMANPRLDFQDVRDCRNYTRLRSFLPQVV